MTAATALAAFYGVCLLIAILSGQQGYKVMISIVLSNQVRPPILLRNYYMLIFVNRKTIYSMPILEKVNFLDPGMDKNKFEETF